MKIFRVAIYFISLSVATACSDGETESTIFSNNLQPEEKTFAFSHPFPTSLALRVNISNLRPEVTVGDTVLQMARIGDDWQGALALPAGDYQIGVIWFENIDGTELQLASYESEITMTEENQTLDVLFEDYDLAFDADSDGFINIEERQQNSNPFDPESPRTDGVNVVVPFIAPPEAPEVDGLFDSVWNSAQYNDVDGEQLSIDNLILGGDNARSDGNTEFQWAALHDDENLYLLVLYEDVETSALFSDSADAQNDDSLDIYWDGSNNSKEAGSSYDGVDDFILRIPLLNAVGIVNTNLPNTTDETRLEIASVSAPYSGELMFFNCVCTSGMHIWEIKIPLVGSGIRPRQPFGFDLQINDDQDGGPRDAKWAWFEESNNQTEDAEVTPSVLGTVLLQ